MTYFVHVLDDDGHFELIDSDFAHLYADLAFKDMPKLTDAQYRQYCAKDNGLTRFVNGEFVYREISVDLTALLQQRKAQLITRLATKTDVIKAEVLTGYPQTEIDSFYRQEKEALAYQADPKADTPMLRQIAQVRGIPFDVLVAKVIEKSSQFAVTIGAIIGARQAFEDRILAATELSQLDEIEKEVDAWQLSI
ncbi:MULTISPECIES: hypothetical protein [Pasteurellaceae]|uniref:hypothetical protein n=1 Tax=Pasteurellaceae TaxID=712 RepID=UPI0029219D4A|nr:hypothetical protein AUSP0112_00045 [uncultured phage]